MEPAEVELDITHLAGSRINRYIPLNGMGDGAKLPGLEQQQKGTRIITTNVGA
jgi:hypothetical protein